MDHRNKYETWKYKPPRRKYRRYPCDLSITFLDTHAQNITVKAKSDKLNFIKIRKTCSLNDTVKRMKRQATYHTKRKYLQISYLIIDIFLEAIKNPQCSAIRK